ncbi:MAG TPA: thioredoxin domain-containing protein [Sphingomonas sp.]|nr:thioredoxin domain-containing protein [Sphingomonas sp.]
MKRILFLAALALAGCSKGDGANNASAAPVAAAAAPAGKSWTETVVKTAEGAYILGNPDAPIKLVEYGSRLCPTCGAFGREAMQPLENTYVASGKVSYEFHDFLVHGVADLPPALLGRCVDPSAYFPVLEQTFQNQQQFNDKLQAMTPAQQQQMQAMSPVQVVAALADQMGVVDFMKQRGLPEAKARACLGDMAQIDALTKATQEASAAGITSTPTFMLNGKKLDNVVTWAQMEQALKAAGA